MEDILPGKVAHASGLLRIGDRILKIANVDLTNGNSEITARVIQVNIIISINKNKLILKLFGTHKLVER